jgi:hypothetical protein
MTSHLSPAALFERRSAAARQFAPPVDANGYPTGPQPIYTTDAETGEVIAVTTGTETGKPKTFIYKPSLGQFIPGTLSEPDDAA